MKTLKSFLIIAALGCGFSPHAQQKESGNADQPPAFGYKKLQLKQASDKIVMASVPKIKTPEMVGFDLSAQMKKIKDECPYLQLQKPTLQLDGERNSNSLVQLKWETTNGWNNREFILERSFDDTLHFESVGSTWAKQVASFKDHYQKPDDNSHNKISFYRIKLLLKDGSTVYSNVAAINGFEIQGIRLYPNPVVANTNISILTETAGDAVISIYDDAGKMVARQTASVSAGRNNRELKLSQLAGGFYTVKVTMPDKTEKTVQLVKQ